MGYCSCGGVEEPGMHMQKVDISIQSDHVTLAGTLLLPAGEGQFPCVIIAGGTMSHTRDGALVDPERPVPPRDALKRLAERLAMAGYASIRWGKRGYGSTPPGPRPTTYEDETEDLIAVMRFARRHPKISRVVVAGESAGAYVACLAAKKGVVADAYVFLGALCSSIENLYAYNYGRLYEYAAANEENLRWAEKTAPFALALGKWYLDMIEAARRGEDSYTLEYAGRRWTIPLERMREELREPPAEQFRFITAPTLILHGDQDMNVPPEDAVRAEQIMRNAGNEDVTRIVIPHADHSFQIAAPDAEERIRERHSFASFLRPYSEDLYVALVAWLERVAPTPMESREVLQQGNNFGSGVTAWEGIRVVGSVTDAARGCGVDTLEGRIGPLLKGDNCSAHYIEMPPGMYCAEHPHATESLIYTVRGRWVLASGGRRHLMQPGSLFWFKAGVPTGYEVPFDEPAFILIFKGHRGESDEVFIAYLQDLAARLKVEQNKGQPFRLEQLPPEHPARVFARQVRSGNKKK